MNKTLILTLTALTIALIAYKTGFQTASKQAEAKRIKLVAEHQAQALKAEQQYSDALKREIAQKQQWFNLAQQQSAQIALLHLDLNKAQAQLKEQAQNAIKQDGNHFNGIGSHSLSIYKRAFGYTD